MMRMSRMTGQEQRGERVVDQGLVVDRHQLLAHDPRGRIEPGARATRQHDALHALVTSCRLRHCRPSLQAILSARAARADVPGEAVAP